MIMKKIDVKLSNSAHNDVAQLFGRQNERRSKKRQQQDYVISLNELRQQQYAEIKESKNMSYFSSN